MRRTRVSGVRVACLALAAAVASTWLSAHAEGEGIAAQGREKSRMCEGCHGVTDYRNAFPDVYRVPKLGEATVGIPSSRRCRTTSRERADTRPMRSIAAALTIRIWLISRRTTPRRPAVSDYASAGLERASDHEQADGCGWADLGIGPCAACACRRTSRRQSRRPSRSAPHATAPREPNRSLLTRPSWPAVQRLSGARAAGLQSGARQNALMNGLAKPLSKREIKELAQYFSRRPVSRVDTRLRR